MANVITNYIWKIPNIEFTHGFMNSGVIDGYGEALFQTYKNTTSPIHVPAAGKTVNKVTFKASADNTFYIGAYRSTLSSWDESGRVETFFSVFYKHPNAAISGSPWIEISFPKGYVGSTAGTSGTLTIRRTIENGCFWTPNTYSDVFYGKYVPILCYHSINRRCHSYTGDSADGYLGWVYSYYVGGTNQTLSDPVPEDIVTGGSNRVFGARVKTTFTVTGAVEDDTIPIFVLDMNNGQRKDNSGGSGTGAYHYTADDYTAGKWAEGCIVPANTAVEVSDGKRFYAGNSLASSVPTSTGVDGTYNKNMAFVQSYNYSSGGVSGTQFCGVAGIQKSANYSGWSDDEYSMGCGIAFFMSATGSNRSFYPMGSWGITQLFPALSAKERTIEFYGQTDSQKVSGKVYVGDPYGSNSYGWPIEGDDEPTWIKRTGYKLVGWYTSRDYTTRRYSTTKVPDGTGSIKLYAKWDPINYTLSLKANATPASAGNENYAVVSPSEMPADKSVAYGTTLASSYLPTPKATSHTFVRWNTKADNSGTTYNTSSTMPASNLTLYAIWKLKEYTVTYRKTDGTNGTDTFKYGSSITINKDGGTGGTDSFTIASNTTLTAPTKTGYTFGGWSHTTGTTTFKATWNENSYKVAWNLDGGEWPSGVSTNQTEVGGAYTYLVNPEGIIKYNNYDVTLLPGTTAVNSYFRVKTPTKTGHTFQGWSITGMDTSDHDYYIGGTQTFNTTTFNTSTLTTKSPPMRHLRADNNTTAAVTFKALWKTDRYNVTVQVASTSSGMGTVEITPTGGTYEYESSVTVKATPGNGYEFDKWVFTGAKTGESTTASTTFNMPAGNVTATAHFKAITYQLIFNLLTTNCPPTITENPSNIPISFQGAYPTLDRAHNNPDWNTSHDTGEWDYEFGGWYIGETAYVAGQTYTTVGNQTWSAKWTKTKIKYIIKWYDTDGYGNRTNLLETDETEYGETPTYDGPALSKPGYTWAGATRGWTPVVSVVTSTAEYDAVYTPISYTITYNLKGGVNSPDNPSTFTIQSDTITLKSPTKRGFTFIRWTTDEAGNNPITSIPTGSTGNKTLYAWWKVELQPFDPAPGEDSSSNDDFGIPLDDLDNNAKYKLTLSVNGDRSENGKSPFTLPANQGEWQTTSPYGWVNVIKVNGQDELTATQLRTALRNNIVFPMDVWRCRIYNPTATLKVELTTIEQSIRESSSTNNEFRISDVNKPQLSNVEYDEGVTTIKNLSLSGADKRFIGNKKSCVLCNVVSSNYQKSTNAEMLYEAVPSKFIVKLDRGSGNSGRTDANWSSGEVEKELTKAQINALIAQYTGPNKKKMTYESGWLEVSGGPSSLDGPFPSIATDLENARLRIRIVDTRHTS